MPSSNILSFSFDSSRANPKDGPLQPPCIKAIRTADSILFCARYWVKLLTAESVASNIRCSSSSWSHPVRRLVFMIISYCKAAFKGRQPLWIKLYFTYLRHASHLPGLLSKNWVLQRKEHFWYVCSNSCKKKLHPQSLDPTIWGVPCSFLLIFPNTNRFNSP